MKNFGKTRTWALGFLGLSGVMGSMSAFAAATDIPSLVSGLTSNFAAVSQLITSIAYVAGLGFSTAAIFKFKQHKDNPQQIPLGTPFALLFVGASLLFMPTIFKIAGQSIFGTTSGVGGNTGVSTVFSDS